MHSEARAPILSACAAAGEAVVVKHRVLGEQAVLLECHTLGARLDLREQFKVAQNLKRRAIPLPRFDQWQGGGLQPPVAYR